MPGQQLAGTHTYSLNVVHGEKPRWAKVLAEWILVPRVHYLAIRFWSFHDRSPHGILSRNQGSAGRKKPPPGIHDRGNMPLKQGQHAAKIGDDNVGVDRERHAVGNFLEELDFAGTAVGGGNLARHLNDLRRLDGKDAGSAQLARE